ncbi:MULTISPECIES: hypothetical protein [Flammeovirga]|uniref:Uncharacterized protein n=1 Tax=Flammeovirga agarivorans TaxID=2726742 RepID=A0A7X8SMG1_9BACT|nr:MULTISPECIES: hypothetical protein [Flammeovirga]NLR92861.1 hypothetical protein [Flammeovirga agarivorans]
MKTTFLFTTLLLASSLLFAQNKELEKINAQEYSHEEYSVLESLGPHYVQNLEHTLDELDWGITNYNENEALKDEITKVSEVYVYSSEDFRLVHYHNGDVHDVDLDQIAQKADLIMSSEGTYYYVLRD